MSLLLDALKNAENANKDKENKPDEEFITTVAHEELTLNITPPIDIAQAATAADTKDINEEKNIETVGVTTIIDHGVNAKEVPDNASIESNTDLNSHIIEKETALQRRKGDQINTSTEVNEKSLQWDLPPNVSATPMLPTNDVEIVSPADAKDAPTLPVNDTPTLPINDTETTPPADANDAPTLPVNDTETIPPADANDAPTLPVDDAETDPPAQALNEPLPLKEQEDENSPQFFHYAKPLNSTKRNQILLAIFVLIGTVAGTILLYIINHTGAQHSLFSKPAPLNSQAQISQRSPNVTVMTINNGSTPHENLVVNTLKQTGLNKRTSPDKKEMTVNNELSKPPETAVSNGKRLSSLDPIVRGTEKPLLSHEAQALNMEGRETNSHEFNDNRDIPELHNVIKIVKHKTSESNNSKVLKAYRYYQQGKLIKANQLYQSVLSNNDRNRDAILGLAAIAVHRNRITRAMSYYKALLSLNPKDHVALTGLLSLNRENNRTQTKSIIKQLIIQKPSATLFFLLGNLYSADKSWPEAQSNYFKAWNRDNSRPDYAYNLAVSLDSLNQRSSALKYYRIALKLSASKIARYDRNRLKQRIRELSRQFNRGRTQ